MITDEDLRASETYFYKLCDEDAIYSRLLKNVAKDSFLAGIEHERKRAMEEHVVKWGNDPRFWPATVTVQKVGWPLSTGPTCGPLERVGERHWRIKDVVGFPKTVVTIQGKELQVLSEPEYLSKLAGND